MERPASLLVSLLSTVPIWISCLQPSSAAADPSVWRQQVIYLVMTDRFENGDSANDTLGGAECFDPNSPTKFHGGDWAGLSQRIDYLKELGVTTVWVTPAYQQVGQIGPANNTSCGYHGYWPDFTSSNTLAVEPKLGGETDLKALIRTLQNNGFKFILDQVVNHAGYNARITTQETSWFNPSRPLCEALGNPDIFCDLAGLPDFDFRNGAAVQYVTQQSKAWLEQFTLDGIRMDTAKHVPLSYLQNTWIPLMKQIQPDLFLVGEILDQNSTERLKPFTEAGFDSVFNFPLQKAMVETFAKGGSVDWVANQMQETLEAFGARTLMLTNLLDNHDLTRFTNETKGDISEDQARRRYHLALGSLFTLPGIPQLYYGDEIGMYGGPDPDNRRDMPDWAWTNAGRTLGGVGFLPNPQDTFSYVQKLIQIRKGNPALHSGYYAEMRRQNGQPNLDVYAFFRGLGDNRIIVVINNSPLPTGLLSIPVQNNLEIESLDRLAMSEGKALVDLLELGAPPTITLKDSAVKVDMPAKTMGIYRLR
ncbi:MAG: alpha-amylase family glycosyl hydrolase [Leptolyngbyaceae cyanobacterium MO_188.B28]|nr:alpha-amylase family glycosyl hydrolase [Leptolyngbyaceae cyanobacterium MO_188.B28]